MFVLMTDRFLVNLVHSCRRRNGNDQWAATIGQQPTGGDQRAATNGRQPTGGDQRAATNGPQSPPTAIQRQQTPPATVS
jgi:hypothetical protein